MMKEMLIGLLTFNIVISVNDLIHNQKLRYNLLGNMSVCVFMLELIDNDLYNVLIFGGFTLLFYVLHEIECRTIGKDSALTKFIDSLILIYAVLLYHDSESEISMSDEEGNNTIYLGKESKWNMILYGLADIWENEEIK